MNPNGSADPTKATIAVDSGRGPTFNGRKKADLAAPGEDIPTPAANTKLNGTSDGTSFAAPHIGAP